MNKAQFEKIEQYMHTCMADSAHDREHVYRVLNSALTIAQTEQGVDMDVLVFACLLHDIGRQAQFADPAKCHARVGSDMAYQFLLDNGYSEAFSQRVRDCISTHRFRMDHPPRSIEAKILFDADKLDVAGAMGIARTLLYQGYVSTPLYTRGADGQVLVGSSGEADSFFQEYKFKLENMYDRFYTQEGRRLALERKQAAVSFYESLLKEVRESDFLGKAALEAMLQDA